MDDVICLALSPIVTAIVSLLKRIPLVKNNPKWVAFFISAVVGTYAATHNSAPGIDYTQIAKCVMTYFSGAVATHEVVDTAQGKRAAIDDTSAPAPGA